jgi:hypothetical protein
MGTPSIDSCLPLFPFSTAKLSLVGGKEGRIGIELSYMSGLTISEVVSIFKLEHPNSFNRSFRCCEMVKKRNKVT